MEKEKARGKRGRARGRARHDAASRRPGDEEEARPPAAEPEGAVAGPPGVVGGPPGAVGGPQGAVGGEQAGAPLPGSGRAVYRGSGKGPKPGNGAGGPVPKVPIDELAQLAIVPEEERRYQRRSFFDDGVYKPSHITEKVGKAGTKMILKGNFFKLSYATDWMLYQYHVTYMPPVESRKMKGALLASHAEMFGDYHVTYMPPVESRKMKGALLASHAEMLGDVRAFDGTILYLPFKLPDKETEFFSLRRHDNAQIKITVRLTCELPPQTLQTLQVMNIIWRRMLGIMGMTQINRHYFDTAKTVQVSGRGLEVIPGFQTSILQYEQDVLLEIDIAHKILRTNTVLEAMYELYNSDSRGFHNNAMKQIVGSIVMTRYNNKTYRVDDIDWDKRPRDTFEMHGGATKSYVDYYFSQYNVEIKDMEQPLLVHKPSSRDRRRGQLEMIYLIPELCVMTGLTEAARSDYSLMRDVAVHTRIAPDGRVSRLLTFMQSLKQNPKVVTELAQWNLRFEDDLQKIEGRQLPQETVMMVDRGNRDCALAYRQDEADWSRDMRGKNMRLAVALNNWIVLFPRNFFQAAKDLVSTLVQVCPPMGMDIRQPTMLELPNDRNESYLMTLREHVNPNVQMVVCVLSNNKKDRYDAIKKFCCIDCPVPSQMVVSRTLSKAKQLMSVATKIAVQMNCKMGGVVWAVPIPLKGTMIVGIDTYHDSSAKGRSCGGVVATTNKDFTRYYSTVTFHMSHQELQDNLKVSLNACLRAFHKEQQTLPEKVIIYRDGVGDGQLDAVYEHELPQIQSALNGAGGSEYKPKLAFVVVKKRINARFFKHGQYRVESAGGGRGGAGASRGGGDMRSGPVNPPPGTVIDTVVTKPCWYDFFLISQSVRQGTVGPTHYNILADTTGMQPDHFQRLSYKLTHMYFNWQGTVRVPAPCMYAHKLAFLSGQSLHRSFSEGLADKLFFL